MRTKAAIAACVVVGSICWSGCRSVETPTLAPRGDVATQRFEAQRFDPLPETNVGPEVVGARGRETERQVAEPSRARWDPRTWVRRFSH